MDNRRAAAERWEDPRPESWWARYPHRITNRGHEPSSPLPIPRPNGWRRLGIASTLLLLSALWHLGRDTETLASRDGWTFFEPLRLVLIGVARAFGSPHTDLWRRLWVLILFVVAFATWCRFYREWLAYRPGAVDVREFDNAADPKDTGRAAYLKSRFCRQLASTSIYPPYAGPAAVPPQNFLVVLGESPETLTNPLAVLPKVMARLWPQSGYLIRATLQERKQEPGCGLSVTVTSFAGGTGSATTTEWGATWEDATCKAAYWAMAKILPMTRLARVAPWRPWRHRDLPTGLFEAYNEAKKRHDERRLDDALWWYREALRLDPFNPDIRMMVASVQEDLGLFLAALDTYHGALCLGELESRYAASLWTRRRDRWRHPFRYPVAMLSAISRRRELIRLRYQYAKTLAYSERTVEDWFATDAVGERRMLRDQIRDRLTAAFVDRYWPVLSPFRNAADRAEAYERTRTALEAVATARVLFNLAALQEFHRLYQDSALAWWVVPRGSTVNRRLLRLARDVWAPLRLGRALHDLNQDRLTAAGLTVDWFTGGQVGDLPNLRRWWSRRRYRRTETMVRGWPVQPERLRDAIGRAQRRRLGTGRLDYLDYYAAAAVYSYALYGYVPVPPPSPAAELAPAPPAGLEDDRRRRSLTGYAVIELQAAMASAGSRPAAQVSLQTTTQTGVASRLRSWIGSSDPDFGRLRGSDEFRFLQLDLYQPMRSVWRRPENVTRIRIAAYVKKLLHDGAGLLERNWHRRCAPPWRGDVHDMIEWLDLDNRTWRLLGKMAEDRAWYWLHRAQFCRLVTEAVDLVRVADLRFPPPVPTFDELVIEVPDGLESPLRRDGAVEKRVADLTAHVDEIVQQIGRVTAELSAASAELGLGALRRLDADGDQPDLTSLREVCSRRAAHWQRVVDLLSDDRLRVEFIDPEHIQLEP
ncbi:hypothetical protein [Micromonospora humida]|uniref:hypothetical protein n=1 Tax=Micromonospora humida TaxID=2809018 RepID=UPI00341AD7C8